MEWDTFILAPHWYLDRYEVHACTHVAVHIHTYQSTRLEWEIIFIYNRFPQLSTWVNFSVHGHMGLYLCSAS